MNEYFPQFLNQINIENSRYEWKTSLTLIRLSQTIKASANQTKTKLKVSILLPNLS